jgi:S-ribosylhomocysteine lyase LuxS involved in autoinducer biosynthesis
MIIKNKLDKTFGPFGTSTGFFMLLGGIIATYYSLIGLLIAFVGAFVAFTSTSTIIDTENKKVKYTDNLFGIFPVGKWMDIKPDMKLGLKKSHRGYVGYVRGTQPVEIHNKDIRIFLYDSNNKQIMPIKKFNSYESSKKEIDNLSSVLGLEIINLKT